MQTSTSNATPRLLTLRDAATYLAMGTWALRRLVWANELSVVQNGKGARLLFDRKDLDKWIEKTKK
jgi:excisionase family DNA binding protein